MLFEQALQNAMQLEHTIHQVKDARTGGVNWEHDNVERYLRTCRSLRNALSPLYEARTMSCRSCGHSCRADSVLLLMLWQTFFQQIVSQREYGMLFLVQLRADLLQVLRKIATRSEIPGLRSLDASLKVSCFTAL